MLQVDLTDDPIDVSHMLSRVASRRAGAAVLFTGTTRQETDGLTTDWLEYDAYRPLARRELWWGFKAALDRFKTISFSQNKNDFIYHPHYLLRALKELHIDFEKE